MEKTKEQRTTKGYLTGPAVRGLSLGAGLASGLASAASRRCKRHGEAIDATRLRHT